jgi:hypothetical protein
MSVLDFPDSPTDGEQYAFNGIVYEWSDAKDAWFVSGGFPQPSGSVKNVMFLGGM